MLSLEGAKIAIVEDDPIMGESLLQRLELEGADVHWWQSGADAVAGLAAGVPDILVCDIRLPDMSGEEVFHQSQHALGHTPVMFITAYAEIDQAVRLMRAGAGDYITKPFSMDNFLERLNHLIKGHVEMTDQIEGSLGDSPAIMKVENILTRVANIDSTVLLTGESGAGKEVAACYLHRHSDRAAAPFIAVNCAAIPANLLESELFGFEKGAFTDAKDRHEGYAERARDGILFLDEVSELPIDTQAKLLRLIQERTFQRVGGKDVLEFKARLISATNVSLDDRMQAGQFREDLYYRINVIHIDVPSLRDRQEDILPLLRNYLTFFAESFDNDVRGLTTLAEEVALNHDWPGNIRELRNRMERAVALTPGPMITPVDLFPERSSETSAWSSQESGIPTLSEARDEAERRHILTALQQTDGQVSKAADLLGISRTTLWEKMRKHEMAADITSP